MCARKNCFFLCSFQLLLCSKTFMQYILFACLGLLASASNTIFNRISSEKVGPLASSTIKSFMITIACFIIACCFGNVTNLFALTAEQYLWIVLLGFITVLDWVFYFLGIKKSHLESFACLGTSSILFFSNMLFSIFMFGSVTNGGKTLNIIFFFLGLACFLGTMLFVILNKKMNRKSKKIWVLYDILSSLMLSLTLLIVKIKLPDVPSDIIAFHQMAILFVLCFIALFASGRFKEMKTIGWKDYLNFFIGSIFNALMMVFRYKAFSYSNAIPSLINVIISADFILVSTATILFFKEKNKKQHTIVVLLMLVGMVLNVLSGLL